jgi:hypothetical protein
MGDTVSKFITDGAVSFQAAGGGDYIDLLKQTYMQLGDDSYKKFSEILD